MQRTAKSLSLNVLAILDKVCLCVGYALTHTHTKSPLWWDPAHILLLVREPHFLCEVIAAVGGDSYVFVQADRCGLCGAAGSPECSSPTV